MLDEPLRVLVVDDDPILREFACVYLSAPQVTIDTAGDGEEGWDRLAGGAYDIALIDIEMPRLDGYGLLSRLRDDARLSDLPVIMVTGREDAISIDRAFELGANSFTVKPVNWRQLSHQVRYVVRAARHEREARRARDQAVSLSRMKSEILTLMRHEFRTPLNAIIGFSELIEKQSLGPIGEAGYVDHARFVRTAGEDLLGLFGDLMLYSSLSSNERELREDEYAPGTVARRALSHVANRHGPMPTIVDLEEKLTVFADRELLERAIFHLLSNAVVHGGGLASMSVATAADGSVMIAVRDRGPGLRDEQVSACLEPFHQHSAGLARRAGGLGLGLPLAKLAAELHGGSLTFESGEGGGCVSLILPASRVVRRHSDEAA
ncbi:response regulator [Phreatobacter sp.]|uniref:hybrid sensor histidine kinase/response regulator n=1 Tax=Phreatobacter sp. TaxID=1966341 RepID=UPI0025D6CCE6|nr:response regulator [Phreatobacter sp.]